MSAPIISRLTPFAGLIIWLYIRIGSFPSFPSNDDTTANKNVFKQSFFFVKILVKTVIYIPKPHIVIFLSINPDPNHKALRYFCPHSSRQLRDESVRPAFVIMRFALTNYWGVMTKISLIPPGIYPIHGDHVSMWNTRHLLLEDFLLSIVIPKLQLPYSG